MPVNGFHDRFQANHAGFPRGFAVAFRGTPATGGEKSGVPTVAQQSPWGVWLVNDAFEHHPKDENGDAYCAGGAQLIVGGQREEGVRQMLDFFKEMTAHHAGNPEALALALMEEALEFHALGEHKAAQIGYIKALEVSQQNHLGGQMAPTRIQLYLARNAKDAGQWDVADAYFQDALAQPGQFPSGLKLGEAQGEHGEVLTHLGQWEQAKTAFEASIQTLENDTVSNNQERLEALGTAYSRLYTLYLDTKQGEQAEAFRSQHADFPYPIIPAGF